MHSDSYPGIISVPIVVVNQTFVVVQHFFCVRFCDIINMWFGINSRDAAMQNRIGLITQSGLLLAVIMAVQIVGLPNPVTGVAVNSILIFSLLHGNLKSAMVLAFLSPFGGLISGHLPVPLLPILPVIVLGNCLLILAYLRLQKRAPVVRVLLPALIKGLVIGAAGYSVIRLMNLLAAKWVLIPVLGLQFFTASVGIILAEAIFARITLVSHAAKVGND